MCPMTDRRLPTVEDWLSACERAGSRCAAAAENGAAHARFLVLSRVGRTGVGEIPGADELIAERRRALGPWKPGERNAVIAFGATVSLWIGPGLLPLFLGRDHPFAVAVLSSVPEAVAALTGAILLFALPISRTQRSTLTWKQAAQIDWVTILLFGGGLSLGALSGATGLARVVGEGITGLVPSNGVVPLTFRGDPLHGGALQHHVQHRRRQHRAPHRHLHRGGGRRRSGHPRFRRRPRRLDLGGAAGLDPAERHRLRDGARPHHPDGSLRPPDGRPHPRAGARGDAGGDERGRPRRVTVGYDGACAAEDGRSGSQAPRAPVRC